jgi:hypothetical protein
MGMIEADLVSFNLLFLKSLSGLLVQSSIDAGNFLHPPTAFSMLQSDE